jgi:hypothetical protein
VHIEPIGRPRLRDILTNRQQLPGLICILVFIVAPIMVLPSVELSKISPWLIPAYLIGAPLLLIGLPGYVFRRRRRWTRSVRNVSLWAVGHGWQYGGGSADLLDYFPGEPFHRGVSRDIQHLLRGNIAGRSTLVIVSRWYVAPDGRQSKRTGSSGRLGGSVTAVVLQLPIAVPQLSIKPGSGGLQLESGAFNKAFEVQTADPEFAYAVLSATTMQWLLDVRPGYEIRFRGPALTVWHDGPVDKAAEIGDITEFAGELLRRIEHFVFSRSWPAAKKGIPIDQIPQTAYAERVGAPLHGGSVAHRGHDCRILEQTVDLGNGKSDYRTVVDIDTPVQWPLLIFGHRGLVWDRGISELKDQIGTGHAEFDEAFGVTGDSALAKQLLTAGFTDYVVHDKRMADVFVQIYSRVQRPGREDVTEVVHSGVLSVARIGRTGDPGLTAALLDIGCDLVDHVPTDVWKHWPPNGPV